MKIHPTDIPGPLLIELRVFQDARGFFAETYRRPAFAEAGIDVEFVQDNLSRSQRGTLRGLHYQIEHPQGKLLQVLRGEVFDVAVDLRRQSATFGKWTGVFLKDSDFREFYIPPGFAHGFYVLSETADIAYKCTDIYHPEHERTLLWNDPALGIDWPITGEPILSDKDRRGLPLAECECYDMDETASASG